MTRIYLQPIDIICGCILCVSIVYMYPFEFQQQNTRTNTESLLERKVYCPGNMYIESMYVVQGMPNNSITNYCFNTPVRRYSSKYSCVKVPKDKCSRETIIDECYPSFPCPANYYNIMKSITIENTRSGKNIISVSTCCNMK